MNTVDIKSVEKDVKQRVAWLATRISLSDFEKDYLEFQMLESVKFALSLIANQPQVSPTVVRLKIY